MKPYGKMVLMALMLLVAIVAIVLNNCTALERATDTPAFSTPPLAEFRVKSGWVFRFTDLNGAVTCWVYSRGYRGGIDCIPTKDIGE